MSGLLSLPRTASLVTLLALAVAILLVAGWYVARIVWMPGRSYEGPLRPLTEAEQAMRERLRRDLTVLAGDIGERNVGRPDAYRRAAEFIAAELAAADYAVSRQAYTVDGVVCANLEAERRGSSRAEEFIVIGAHYDTVRGCPGANDNGTGVVAMLELARALRASPSARTIRFVAFANEEPPWFQTPLMGSYVYAERCRSRGERVVGMISLETLGCYSDRPGSQHYPFPFNLIYPDRGDFVAFVSNGASRTWLHQVVAAFRRHARFPSQGGAVPDAVPYGGFSDQWSFWQNGYPALMITDTAMFRYAHYHAHSDSVEQVDFDRLTRVVEGLRHAIRDLADSGR